MAGCHRFGLLASLFVLACAAALPGCDFEPAQVEVIAAETLVEGAAKDSEAGAFRVTLRAEEGLAVGPNKLIVRLGFHDLDDPLAPGRGIPGADVALYAWMPDGGASVEGVRGRHIGEGEYELAFTLPQPGVWQLDFDLAVGDGVDDSVSFAVLLDR